MTDLDPERFTLRQAAQARDDFAQVMDELDFVKELISRIPTRKDQAFVPLRTMFGSAVLSAALVILWLEVFWRHCLRAELQPVGHVHIGTEDLRPRCSCRCAPRRGRGRRLALLRGQRQWTGRCCGANSARATGYAQFSTGLPSSP